VADRSFCLINKLKKNCSTAVRRWFLRNDLHLNADKSEVVILDIASQLRSAANIREVEVVSSRLQVAPKTKSLGVTIDWHLRFDCHAKEVVKACNYHTRALCHVRTVLTDDLAQTAACSIVGSRLDYCKPCSTVHQLRLSMYFSERRTILARVVCHREG